MVMRHPRLPVETWQTILENAIHIPMFLESSPIMTETALDHSQIMDDGAYWQSERVRNALRRVCTSWNIFLKKFDHRYITMVDVIHDLIPFHALQSAVRIQLVDCRCTPFDPVELCRKKRNMLLNPEEMVGVLDTIKDGTPVPWRLEILDVGVVSPLSSKFLLAPHRTINLKSVTSASEGSLLPLLHSGVNLRVLWGSMYPLFGSSSVPKSFRSVTTLRFPMTFGAEDIAPELPALRHLQISTLGSTNLGKILSFLTEVGKQLLTLFWFCTSPNGPQGGLIDPTIWELCPLVEVLSVPPGITWVSPPDEHPIHTIGVVPSFVKNVDARCSKCHSIHDITTDLGASIAEYAASGVCTIAIAPKQANQPGFATRPGLRDDAECLLEQARAHGVRLLDSKSEALLWQFEWSYGDE